MFFVVIVVEFYSGSQCEMEGIDAEKKTFAYLSIGRRTVHLSVVQSPIGRRFGSCSHTMRRKRQLQVNLNRHVDDCPELVWERILNQVNHRRFRCLRKG